MLAVPGILWTYFSSSFLMTPSAPITTGIDSVSICHILAISIPKSLYLESFLTTLTYVLNFLAGRTAISIIQHLWFMWSLILWYLVCWPLFLYQCGLAYPQNFCWFIFYNSFWFVFIPFVCRCHDVIIPAHLPMDIWCCVIMSLNVFRLRQNYYYYYCRTNFVTYLSNTSST